MIYLKRFHDFSLSVSHCSESLYRETFQIGVRKITIKPKTSCSNFGALISQMTLRITCCAYNTSVDWTKFDRFRNYHLSKSKNVTVLSSLKFCSYLETPAHALRSPSAPEPEAQHVVRPSESEAHPAPQHGSEPRQKTSSDSRSPECWSMRITKKKGLARMASSAGDTCARSTSAAAEK